MSRRRGAAAAAGRREGSAAAPPRPPARRRAFRRRPAAPLPPGLPPSAPSRRRPCRSLRERAGNWVPAGPLPAPPAGPRPAISRNMGRAARRGPLRRAAGRRAAPAEAAGVGAKAERDEPASPTSLPFRCAGATTPGSLRVGGRNARARGRAGGGRAAARSGGGTEEITRRRRPRGAAAAACALLGVSSCGLGGAGPWSPARCRIVCDMSLAAAPGAAGVAVRVANIPWQ